MGSIRERVSLINDKTTVLDGGNRDARGRFAKGNPGGPGNPSVKRAAAFQEAIRRAIKRKDLEAVLRKLLELAKTGDIQAARIVLDRTLGRVTPAQVDAQAIDIPSMTTPEGCLEGFNRIFDGLRTGKLNAAEAGTLAGIVELNRRSIETLDLAKRLETLEALNAGGRINDNF